MPENLHKDHRMRVRKDFLENGISDDIPSHKLLEALLFYSIPRVDTNEIAHRLLNEFGSVAGVFQAEIAELMRVEGIGENSAMLIKLMVPLLKRYQADKATARPRFSNMDQICEYLISRYFGIKSEVFMVMSFDNSGNMIACDRVFEGDMSRVLVPIRDIVQTVLKRNSACVVIAHNHISGDAVPSKADIAMTKSLKITLNQVGVELLDHVVVAFGDAVSFRESQKYKYALE